MIEEFGSWTLFQELLRALKGIAARHRTSLTNVATRYIIQHPQIGAVIIGARAASHLEENISVFDFTLDSEDIDAIRAVTARRRGPYGDVFDLERVKDGPHGSIMRYNLNKL
jgi:aryl-alcohol dehydrogenase-like predicted oxidoreductase